MKRINVIASAKRVAISAFVAAVAVCGNAASLDWKMAGDVLGSSPQGTTGKEGTCGFYTMLVFTSDQANDVKAALSAVGGVDFDALTGAAISSYQAKRAGSFTRTLTDLEAGSYTLFGVILDTQATGLAANTAKYYYLTGEVTQNTYDPTGMDSATVAVFGADQMTGTWTTTTSSSSGGESETVPEPTSGLLLLVGMGALALRRKQK